MQIFLNNFGLGIEKYGNNKIRRDYIKLGQALKAAGLVESGVEAKEVISQGLVVVDGEIETRRGRKLYDGAEVEFDGNKISIQK